MRKGPKHWRYHQKHKYHDCDTVREDDDRPPAPTKGTIADPDGEEGVYSREGVADSRVFVLWGKSARKKRSVRVCLDVRFVLQYKREVVLSCYGL